MNALIPEIITNQNQENFPKYLSAAKESDPSEQCLTRISVSDPPLHSAMDRSMALIFRSNSGVHQRADSVGESKWTSRSRVEKREGSLQAWSQDLQTSMGPVHRSWRVSRDRTLVRHSWVNSDQSELSPDSAWPPWLSIRVDRFPQQLLLRSVLYGVAQPMLNHCTRQLHHPTPALSPAKKQFKK